MTGSNRPLSLKISEIFYSIQGEASRAGLPTVFVRLTGCPLRCVWCDTEYAFSGGQSMTLTRILETVGAYAVRQVCVTGGEPLAQANCLPLLSALCDADYDVSLETSGALDISGVDSRVSRIVDLKAPGSGESAKNRWKNIDFLSSQDELKFVIKDRADYEWARDTVVHNQLDVLCPLLFSPVQGALEPRMLAEWILADQLPVRLQLQLHKLLWGNIQGK
ncbi:7-carboxy-7-deazaguanine synthase QueE [Propionivibrio sp.]|uniref:7-carboxy-7-deazaguanine synthase QueE n=1 Tax=Propionivibrio sp. TaxID=2212460 RepID=UPI0025F9F7B6|nr:7-carboxy-7-deazaguanine synthase QueE [Propionivibrio sp.]MBK7354987.1 7-carboxy-7-deazaguanine synthase QueE [Propionivibrio sp.]MBK8743513.1 7-carboxy-7-deazaguanine synthase QueE [Propionivibrio sp.]MBK8892817.1 7-carboxy-7-deazaguanine synthase QueE [Propionivibrio sp.]MBL0206529.1 7-carboxy-7-deazaguanine synthase QueE [Propionivibrio sp.]